MGVVLSDREGRFEEMAHAAEDSGDKRWSGGGVAVTGSAPEINRSLHNQNLLSNNIDFCGISRGCLCPLDVKNFITSSVTERSHELEFAGGTTEYLIRRFAPPSPEGKAFGRR